MNTNIITQLAKVIGPETKESFAVIKKDRGALHSIKMGLATAVLFASGGMATAQQPYAAGAIQYYGLYAPAQYAPGFSRSDRISGARGGEGLGAIPRHYEYNRNGVRD